MALSERASLFDVTRATNGNSRSLAQDAGVCSFKADSSSFVRASAAEILAPFGILGTTFRDCFNLDKVSARFDPSFSNKSGDRVPLDFSCWDWLLSCLAQSGHHQQRKTSAWLLFSRTQVRCHSRLHRLHSIRLFFLLTLPHRGHSAGMSGVLWSSAGVLRRCSCDCCPSGAKSTGD